MLNQRASQSRIFGLAAFSLAGAMLLSGCAFNGGALTSGTTTTGTGASKSSTGLGGIVHGGQQAVVGSTVVLWAAGTTGSYGTGATKIATTTTDAGGSFSFNSAQGTSPCTAGQNLYITATGGNAGGGKNNSLAMMAALPTPCVTGSGTGTTAAASVFLDEVTTVAAVSALQQFMSINTGAAVPYAGGTATAPWMIGAPSTNTTGLANAFLQTANLANFTAGTSQAFTQDTTINSVVYTNTITPDSKKINGLADILAVCINDTTGNLCTGSAGVLTLTSISNVGASTTTTVVPEDTIQAMYNMATLPNPSLYAGSPAAYTSTTTSTGTVSQYWTNSNSTTTYLATLWSDINAQAPFQTYYPTTPTDTTLSVAWKVTQGTANYSTYPGLAIDGLGNIWYALTPPSGQTASSGLVTAYNQAGNMLFTPVTTTGPLVGGWLFSAYTGSTASYALGGPKANPLAIDTNNNAWYASFYTTPVNNTGNTLGATTGTSEAPLVEITPAGSPSGYLVGESDGDIMIDGNNNLFFENVPAQSTIRYYDSELLASGTPAYSTYYGGTGRESSAYFNGGAIDQSSSYLVWPLQSTCAAIPRNDTAIAAAGGTYPTSSTNYSAGLVTLATTGATTCVFAGAIDANNNMWGAYPSYIEYIVAPGTGAVATPTVTQFAIGTGTSFGGLTGPGGIAVDGAGNIWVPNSITVSSVVTGGVSEFAPALTGSGQALTPTLTPLSPSGSSTTPSYGFSTANAFPKLTNPRIDASGNLWLENQGSSSTYYLVGVAAPVVTPFSVQISKTAIGKKP